jgi:hypothetical protein
MDDYRGEEINGQACVAYVSTWNTKELLKLPSTYCPLCEIDIEYGSSTDKPLKELETCVKQFEKTSRSPVQFIRAITTLYNEKIRPRIKNILYYIPDGSGNVIDVDEPEMTSTELYLHYKTHIKNNWLCEEETTRQVEVMLQRTADTCMTMDGPVNPNSVNTFERLVRIRHMLNDSKKKI